MDWIYLLWDRDTFLAAMNAPMDLQFPPSPPPKKKPPQEPLSYQKDSTPGS